MLLEATILLRDYFTELMFLKLPSTSQSEVFKNGKLSVRNFGGKIMMDSRVLHLFACAEMLRRLRDRKRMSMLLEATILLRDYPPEPMILKLSITSYFVRFLRIGKCQLGISEGRV